MRKFLITVEGKQYDVCVEEVGAETAPAAGTAASAPVQSNQAEVKSAAANPQAQAKQVSSGGTKLTSPMPGMIAGFKVEDGANVKKGQPVVVLEAMKMENDLIAPCDGVISFKVQKGVNVDTGAVIAVIS